LAAEFAVGFATRAAAPAGRLRLGNLSCDFHQHATALLMVEMLEAHDRHRFELYAYSHGADDGLGMRQRLQARFDHFSDIPALAELQAARATTPTASTCGAT
jgi:predicted O-linked N-acetylglucosamine transferase (SPINDLY family)